MNTGKGEAILLLQRAINVLRPGTVTVDGKIGPNTREAANAADLEALIAAYRQQRLSYYEEVVRAHPGDEKFLAGWTARALK